MLSIPYPPSVNRLWRNVRGRTLLSKAGRQYRGLVAAVPAVARAVGFGGRPVNVSITAWLPDARRRDADNLFKACLDALGHAGLYDDDSQIMRLSIHKAGIDRMYPRLDVTIDAAPPS